MFGLPDSLVGKTVCLGASYGPLPREFELH